MPFDKKKSPTALCKGIEVACAFHSRWKQQQEFLLQSVMCPKLRLIDPPCFFSKVPVIFWVNCNRRIAKIRVSKIGNIKALDILHVFAFKILRIKITIGFGKF